MQGTGKLKKYRIILGILLGIAIAVLLSYLFQLSQRHNASGVSYLCPAKPTANIAAESLEPIEPNKLQQLSGRVRVGQDVGYSFQAKSGQRAAYRTRTDNLCIWLYGSDGRVIQSDEPLPKDGEYTIQVATMGGNRTFGLDFTIHDAVAGTGGEEAKAAAQLPKAPSLAANSFLGHLPYQEPPQSSLVLIASYAQGKYQRFEFLHEEAAKALMKMIYAARDEGVWIVPVSAFRTIERQKKLFDAQVERRGSKEAAAEVSAPPGHSEHHTGYAIDLGDGRFPKQDITTAFADTDAYRWLLRHAKEFGFELSFPPRNAQGVIFEPWHWRFVGSDRAANIFANARKLYQ